MKPTTDNCCTGVPYSHNLLDVLSKEMSDEDFSSHLIQFADNMQRLESMKGVAVKAGQYRLTDTESLRWNVFESLQTMSETTSLPEWTQTDLEEALKTSLRKGIPNAGGGLTNSQTKSAIQTVQKCLKRITDSR